MTDRADAVGEVQGQSDRDADHGGKEGGPQRPALTTADAEPGERDDRHAQRDDESRDGDLQVADVLVQVKAERFDLLGRPADVRGRETQFDESREVADQEHDAVAHEAHSRQRDQIRARIDGGGGPHLR